MKIKLVDAIAGYMALQRIGVEKLPIKLAFIFQRNMRVLEPDVKSYEEKRVELIKTKYGKEDVNKNWTVIPEKMEKFNKEIESLGSVEIEPDIRVINLDDININIAPNDLFALDWMFIETSTQMDKPKIEKLPVPEKE
jgi:hypothetical protein